MGPLDGPIRNRDCPPALGVVLDLTAMLMPQFADWPSRLAER
jgi:hypothetical protein